MVQIMQDLVHHRTTLINEATGQAVTLYGSDAAWIDPTTPQEELAGFFPMEDYS